VQSLTNDKVKDVKLHKQKYLYPYTCIQYCTILMSELWAETLPALHSDYLVGAKGSDPKQH